MLQEGIFRPRLKDLVSCPNTPSCGSVNSVQPAASRWQCVHAAAAVPHCSPGKARFSQGTREKSPEPCEGQAEAPVMPAASTCALLCFRWVGLVPLSPLPRGSYQGPSWQGLNIDRGPRGLADPQIRVFVTLQSWVED